MKAHGSKIQQKKTLPGKQRKEGDRKVMNKILKRLLSVVLAVVMVIGLVPLSGVTTVEAANDNNTAGMTIYLDASIVLGDDNAQWDSGSSISATISYNDVDGGGSSTVVLASVQNKDHWYSLTLEKNAWQIQFFRTRYTGDSFTLRLNGRQEDADNVARVTGWKSGEWTGETYSESDTPDPTGKYTVYFDTSGNSLAQWNTNQIYIYGYDSNGNSGIKAMRRIAANLYSYTFDIQYPTVIFLNNNAFSSNNNRSNQTTDQTVPWTTMTNPTFTLDGGFASGDGKKTGNWTEGSGESSTTSTFNVDATLVDYFNDQRVDNPDNVSVNQGLETGPDKLPYKKLNDWISGLNGYALNGVNDNKDSNAPVPLYFGDLLNQRQTLNWYWKGANVAFGSDYNTANSVSAQGIVGDYLVDGHLVTSYTNGTENTYSKVPFFEHDTVAFPGQDTYMRFYEDLEFPFTATTTDGVTVYSFDSANNTVYYDYQNNRIVRDDSLVIHDYSEQTGNTPHDSPGDRGYFPFNSTDDKNALNFGFGTKFTIPFTVDPSGTDKNGNDVTFNFTGDDDVWVYIDGALVLDMGGAHNKASGNINFKTQKATVTTLGANAKQDNIGYSGEGRSLNNGSESVVSFQDISVLVEGSSEPISLADYMKQSGTVHTLTMYYMERGMWNSNMSINFSFVPVPSGLSLSKDVKVENVNDGLKDAVKSTGEFDFAMGTRTSKPSEADKEYTSATGVSYTRDYEGAFQESDTIGTDGLVKNLSNNALARNFKRDNENAFKLGTYFQIVEQGSENYDTSWQVTDIKAGRSVASGTNKTATFQLGQEDPENPLASVQYNINFVNTPKVGTLQLSKAWNGTAPANGKYEFTIKVDLSGGENYAAYPLAFTSTDTSRTDLATTAEGKVSLAAGETITFTGIPAGASYQIEETNPGTDAAWTIDSVTGGATWTTGTYVASGKIELEGNEENSVGETDTVTFTNKDVVTALEPNKIVIDYGKAVTVDVIADDRANGNLSENVNAQVVGFEAYDLNKTKPSKTDYAEANPTYTESANGDYSVTEDGKVQFQLKRFLSEVEKVYCVVQVGSDSNSKYYLNELDIIPATTMYYETDFSDAITYTNGDQEDQTAKVIDNNNILSATSTWMVRHSTNGSDNLQDDGAIGQPSTSYGYDTSYNDDKDYSNGSTSFINVAEGADATKMYAQFSFTGTGFDIISATGTEAGTIKAQIYQGTNTTGTPYKTLTVANIGASTLYQIPVLSCERLPHGTYTVKILVYGAVTNTAIPALNRGGEFCFDAVRIYNPINIPENTAETDTTDAGIAQSAYKADKEAFEKHFELRDAILSAEDFDSTSDSVDGVIYIDATEKNPTGSSNVATVKDYESAGPNNETYLKPSAQEYETDKGKTVSAVSAIGFALHTDKIPESIQVGAKSVSGQAVSLDVTLENPDNSDIVDGFTINNLSHATVQNYSTKDRITGSLQKVFAADENGGYVTYVYISNLGYCNNVEDLDYDNTGDGILSITDIKATFAEKSDIHTISSPAVLAAFQSHLDQGEPIIDEGAEVESLKLYEAKFTNSSIRYTQNATLEVKTSADVAEIVVVNENGNEVAINPTYEEDNDGKLWTMKFKPGKVGTRTFTVYGLDANGAKTNTETVKINAKIR